jgi:hypothetical protein
MGTNSYETGRSNLPFVGISTFGKNRFQHDWDVSHADVAVMGAPLGFGTQRRGGRACRRAPSARPLRCSRSATAARCGAAEKPWVTGPSRFGIRNVSSTLKECHAAARAMGSDILSVRQMGYAGGSPGLDRIPAGSRCHVMIDIDGFDPSIAAPVGLARHDLRTRPREGLMAEPATRNVLAHRDAESVGRLRRRVVGALVLGEARQRPCRGQRCLGDLRRAVRAAPAHEPGPAASCRQDAWEPGQGSCFQR